MNIIKASCTFLFIFSHLLHAQSPYTSSSDILQKLQTLNTVGSVLYIAAHPDDENTRLIPYLTYERKLRTGYLSLTRGDGGQNLIGKEQGEPLGLIRTHELLAARKIDGAEQYFTRANDFGFSKNPEETFAIWNKDSILADVVWVIRNFKPDVIISRFPTTGEGGHGHHTASAILAVEAFEAAADPSRFPEQLKYTSVWQAKRLFWNTFNFGGNNTTSPDQLKIDIGGFNQLLGKSYGEIASDNRSMHKSQGFGTAKTRGTNIEYFKQLKGDVAKNDLFEGIDVSWNRFPPTVKFKKLLDQTQKRFDPLKPDLILPDLIAVYKQLQQVDEKEPVVKCWKIQKLKETETLLLASSGLWMEAYASEYSANPGREINITAQIINRNPNAIKLNSIRYMQQDSATALMLKPNELYTFKHKETLPGGFPYSNPYWLNEEHSNGTFLIRDQQLIGKAQNDPSVTVRFNLSILDLNLNIERPVVYKFTDPAKGELYRPLEILPPVTLNLDDKVYAFTDTTPKKIQVLIRSTVEKISGTLQWTVPECWRVTCAKPNFKLDAKGSETFIELTVRAGANCINGKISFAVKLENGTYSAGIQRMEYDHIPSQFILSEAKANILFINLKTAGKNIGYIPGAGDDVVSCLRQIGYTVTILDDELLNTTRLSQFNAIVTGVRAYNTNNRLQAHYEKLMTYVKEGGNLIVQYNTNNRIGPLVAKIGPYPFTISRDRITDENAEVRILNAQHPVLNMPNKITASDFENWVQERGIYSATELDKNYETVLSMNDPNEKPIDGSLIITKYGRGNFVYTGLVFFRELPAGVPGAYRLFVNLLSISGQESVNSGQ